MREKEIPERVDEDSPDRCDGITAHGQCTFKRVENSKFCRIHGGNATEITNRKNAIYQIKAARVRERHEQFSDAEGWRSTREEIGILRLTLEEILNKCDDSSSLTLSVPQISQLVGQIDKLINNSLKLDEHLGKLISEEKMILLINALLDAVYETIGDEEACAQVALKFKEIAKDIT